MRRLLLCLTGTIVTPLLLAALAVPAQGASPAVAVTSPAPEGVVEGLVLFQGTAEDSDGDLRWIEIDIEARQSLLKLRIPGNQFNADWEIPWNTVGEADGVRAVSVWAKDKAGQISAPTDFTLVVDNAKEPVVQAVDVLFDATGDGVYAPWQDLDAAPTTRLALELSFSEEMEPGSVEGAVAFEGGSSQWTFTTLGESLFSVNVSFLQANTSYRLTLSSSAADMAGNSLAAPFNLTFHTSAEPTPGTPEGEGGLALPFSPVWLWIGGGAAAGAVGVALAWRSGVFRRLRGRLQQRRHA